MSRFLTLAGVAVTDPAAPRLPIALGIDVDHYWSAHNLPDNLFGTDIGSLADLVGDHHLTANVANGDRIPAVSGAVRHIVMPTAGSGAFATASGKTIEGAHTVIMVTRNPSGYASVYRASGYAVTTSGNGRWSINSYSAPTTISGSRDTGFSFGTGWNVVIARLDGTATSFTVNGVFSNNAGTIVAPTNTGTVTTIGGGPNVLHAGFVATTATLLDQTQQAAMHARIASQLGLA